MVSGSENKIIVRTPNYLYLCVACFSVDSCTVEIVWILEVASPTFTIDLADDRYLHKTVEHTFTLWSEPACANSLLEKDTLPVHLYMVETLRHFSESP